MYKCYACGREIERPGESCPYCRFPVISTLHGEAGEEEQIRQFAEEYKKANPQFFTKIEPKSAAEDTTPKAEPKKDAPKDTSGKPAEAVPAAAQAADSLEIDWKKRLEELLQREQQLKQKDEELRKREELQKQQEEKQKAEAEKRIKEEKERKILEENQRKLQEENKRRQEEENRKKLLEENQRRLQEENQRKAKEAEASGHKKKSHSGFLAVLFIGIICAGLYLYFKRPDLIEKWFGSEGTITEIAESIQGKGKETAVVDKTASVVDFAEAAAEEAAKNVINQAKLTIPSAEIGDTVYFGWYEQDNDLGNGREPLAWRVIDVSENGNRALLLGMYSLSNISYNPESESADWMSSYARRWLAQEVYEGSFSDYEKSIILPVSAGNIYEFRKTSASDTDYVFCLSAENVRDLLPNESDRLAQNTPYAQRIMKEQMLVNYHYPDTQAAVDSLVAEWEQKYGERCSWWWLKDPGYDINASGELKGGSKLDDLNSILPALWIDLEKAREQGVDVDIESGGIG